MIDVKHHTVPKVHYVYDTNENLGNQQSSNQLKQSKHIPEIMVE